MTPLSYGLFKAINHRFFVRPAWLVYEQGAITISKPFDDHEFSDQIEDRELLSVVCDRLFKTRFEEEIEQAKQIHFGPGGVVERVKSFLDDLNNPDRRKLIPVDVIVQFADVLEKTLPLLKASITQSDAVEKIIRGAPRRKSNRKSGV